MIVCVSQRAELDFLNGTGIDLTRWSTIKADPDSGQTSLEEVYAAGDVVSGPATVITAVAAGRRVAEAVLRSHGRWVEPSISTVPKVANAVSLLRRRSIRQFRVARPRPGAGPGPRAESARGY